MKNITYISTRHKEIGKCNSNELCQLIYKLNPEVIFLEAFENTYSNYAQFAFKNYGVYHEKLEIQAIQKYNHRRAFEYIPVLNNELLDDFDKKYDFMCENIEFQKMIDLYNFHIEHYGFKFLNSKQCIELHEKMRSFENQILKGSDLSYRADEAIDIYENEMLGNIYKYCENNQFNKAIFMCGSGHRKAIIEKTSNQTLNDRFNVKWDILESFD